MKKNQKNPLEYHGFKRFLVGGNIDIKHESKDMNFWLEFHFFLHVGSVQLLPSYISGSLLGLRVPSGTEGVAKV